ncbi:TonB-dependent receptor [Arenibacter aquaticus]|uniref:TonB-dependent receptor n=1 Tax=Arenibacter aquaticus TaxID=2489054 RepID=A0A3S0CLA9_9FLAO|nr:TonB-dependent receptor [Arenibacter aquaticus]RTE52372.1 TonB-dependent receptor [Arenibacter aquaticus]
MKQKFILFKEKPVLGSSRERGKHKYVLFSLLFALAFNFHLGYSNTVWANEKIIFPEQIRTIKGVVKDASGVPVMGANVVVLGTARGVLTNFDGEYEIKANTGDVLEFSFLGMATKRATVGDSDTIDITMEESAEALEEVVLVSFGKQKKKSLISSISTVKPADLKIPSSNLTTALAGNVAGIIAYQRTGEPGADDANFFIRGVTSFGYGNSPLILIDGVELTTRDLARLQPDDIASFSIMKDATATSLYGARGANGVIYVTTKEGVEGPARISARIEASISSATQNVDFADPITYMQLHNEAVRTRDPLGILPYSQRKVDQTIAGNDPILYPTTNWQEELFKDYTLNKRFNFSVNGGGKVARYYVSVAASQDNGVLDVPSVSNYNSNINYQQFQLRSNTNISLTETTKLKMSFIGNYDDYTGPLDSGEALYKKVMRSNPVYFRPYYEADAANEYTNHILFGNYGDGNYLNPYADMVKGYRESGSSKIITQIELEQDLKSITQGLMGKVVINANRESGNAVNRSYNPFYYQPRISTLTNELILNPLNEETGTEYLGYNEGNKFVTSSTYFESSLTYNKNINELYDVSGMLVFTMNNRRVSNAGNLQESLPFRNMGLAGRFTLSSRDKYFGEFTFGYNGSERFDKKERWGYFPSLGLGWIISNEEFFKDYKDVVTNLKLKTTYGLVGNDQIGSASDRFFYLSQVNLSDDGRGYVTGSDFDNYLPGVSIQRYANDQISWETAEKFNLGLELGLFDKWNLEADFFKEYRSNILANRIVLASMGLESGVRANIGEAKSTGIDGTLVYNNSFNKDFWVQARANFTYATSKIVKIEEPDYSETPWLSRVGQPINQVWGYVAERLFVDENEVNNSPVQTFGEYSGGDIKYKDINGDGRISGLDRVPIGNPTSPEIVYGFGVSAGYKGFDISCFFQGLANESFWINPYETAPFVDIHYDGEPNWDTNNQLLQVWADSHWSENNRDLYAKWPRLSPNISGNNTQTSTWFMQDGSFLRLKSLEVGYNLPQNVLDKIKMDRIRFYVTGNNLLAFSNFKLWDPEMAGNGLSYPTQRVINAGVQLSL